MYRNLSVDVNALENDRHSPGDNTKPPSRASVEQCLANFFRPEDREIKCEKCEDGTEATQTLRILSRPKALLLHLKRFVLVERQSSGKENEMEITFQKNRSPVELTEELSLDDFMKTPAATTAKPSQYALKAIVHHIGNTANSGHYTADALRFDHPPTQNREGQDGDLSHKDMSRAEQPQWVSYDDGVTKETTLAEVRGRVANQRTAYMLLYSIE